MQAVVTGASGLLGGNLAVELRARGHAVRTTRRGSSRIGHLDGHGLEWVDADLDDAAALERAFRSADVVFHCAALVSIRRTPTPALVRANVDGTRNVLAAFERAGAKRLVFCSTVGAIGLSEDGRPCTEESRWNFDEHGLNDGYVTTKHASQQLALEAAARGLDVVIANPTYMIGPYDAKPSSGRMVLDVARRRVPGWTDGFNNFVDVRDVARGMLLVAEKGRRGEKYILGHENITYREMFERIARVAGVRPPPLRIPRPIASAIGLAGDLVEAVSGREPVVNSMTTRYGYCRRFQFSSEKAKRELGYAPGPIEPAIADALAWFRSRGML